MGATKSALRQVGVYGGRYGAKPERTTEVGQAARGDMEAVGRGSSRCTRHIVHAPGTSCLGKVLTKCEIAKVGIT